jgi:hypothetical protein
VAGNIQITKFQTKITFYGAKLFIKNIYWYVLYINNQEFTKCYI